MLDLCSQQNRNESRAVFVKLDHTDELKNKEIVTIFRKFLQAMQVEMESDVAIRDLVCILMPLIMNSLEA